MKAALLILVVGSAIAAPTQEVKTDIIESARTKKSAYGPPPCAGGPLAPVALYLSAQPAGLGSEPHYRENEQKEDTKETARSYYNSPAAGIGAAGIGAASAAGALALSGSAVSGADASVGAVGVFPNAKLGGCAIPLLLSCAPNVVSGHLAHAPAQHASYPAYKASEIDTQRQNQMKSDLMKEKSSDVQSAASVKQEKQSMMEDPELESQTLFHHSRPMGMGFMHSHHHDMMDFPHHFGHGHF